MKPTLKLMAVFVLLLVTFHPQTAVSAEIYKNEGRTAWASFYHTDASGCITLHVNIEIWDEGINSIAVTRQDRCTHQYFEAYGNKLLSKREVKFTGNMDPVRLKTTVRSPILTMACPLTSLSISPGLDRRDYRI